MSCKNVWILPLLSFVSVIKQVWIGIQWNKRKVLQKSIESMRVYLNAETEGKSLEAAMTANAATANPNWKQRRARPPRVPGMPSMSFILTIGASPPSVVGVSSTGWTDALLAFISLLIMQLQSINSFLPRPCAPQFSDQPWFPPKSGRPREENSCNQMNRRFKILLWST